MDLAVFLSQALHVECRAEHLYRQLSGRMQAAGHTDAAAFFGEMAGFSRLHRQSIERRSGLSGCPEPLAIEQEEGEVPRLVHEAPDLQQAIETALAAEREAAAWYRSIAAKSTDPAVQALASEFADEEDQHAEALERFLGRRPY